MNRFRYQAAGILLILLTSCARPAPSVPTVTPSATVAAVSTVIAHAPEIRFALIGTVTNTNVWALFDSRGYSFNNYAVESSYWPRLYHISVPGGQFEAEAAGGPPSAIAAEGNFYTGTVPLRADLTWTDGTPFTAEDVAFTVNTVLAFQLGFDWGDAYSSAWLDHAQAVDAHTIKYYFKKQPNTGVWQFGVLQGPVVQKKYWEPRIAEAAELLPAPDLITQIDALKSKVTTQQAQVNALNTLTGTTAPGDVRQAQADLSRQQGNLDQAINDLASAQAALDNAMKAGRESLYILYGGNEPRLGAWMQSSSENGSIQNQTNLQFPLQHANFDRAVYVLYPTETAAVAAWLNGDVDLILTPNGLSAAGEAAQGNLPKVDSMTSPTRNLRFLVFNPLSQALGDPSLHQALACLLEPVALTRQLQEKGAALQSFVVPQEAAWYNAAAVLPCNGRDSAGRLDSAVQILRSAGYTWTQVPSAQNEGQGLSLPNGTSVPALTLLTPSSDQLRVAAAHYIEQQARRLGIPLTAESASSDQVNYAVFSSHNFDMAILAWKVSAFPSYLCDWFGAGNPLEYNIASLISKCGTLNETSDLVSTHQQIMDIQSSLADYLPFIPLYTELTREAFRKIRYPFSELLDGLSDAYGAPSLAIPASP